MIDDKTPIFNPVIRAVNFVRDAISQEDDSRGRARFLRERLQYLENWDVVEEVLFEIFEYERQSTSEK